MGALVRIFTALLGRGLGAVAQLLVTFALGRLIGASGSGVLMLGISIVIIASTLGRLGLEYSLLKHAAQAYGQKRFDRYWGIAGQASLTVFWASTGLAILLAVVGAIMAWALDVDSRLISTLPCFLIAIPIFSLIVLQGELLKACDQPAWGNLVPTALPPIGFVLLLVGQFQLGYDSLVIAAVNYTLAMFIALGIGWILLARAVPKPTTLERLSPAELWEPVKSLFWFSSLSVLNNWIPLIALACFTTSEAWGQFGAITRLATAVSFVLWASNAIVPPRLARLHAEGDLTGMQTLASKAGLSLTCSAAIPALLLIFFGNHLLGWMRPEFVPAAMGLAILAGAQWFNAAAGSIDYLLVVTGNERQLRKGAIGAASINVMLCCILVPQGNVTGAAIAAATSIVCERLWYCFAAWKATGIITLPLPVSGSPRVSSGNLS